MNSHTALRDSDMLVNDQICSWTRFSSLINRDNKKSGELKSSYQYSINKIYHTLGVASKVPYWCSTKNLEDNRCESAVLETYLFIHV